MDHKATVKIQNAPLGMHSWGSLWLLEMQKYLSLFKFLSFFISVHFQKIKLWNILEWKISSISSILPGFRPRHGRIKSPSIEVVRTWAQRQDQDEDRKEDMHHQQHIKGWHLPWMFSRPCISLKEQTSGSMKFPDLQFLILLTKTKLGNCSFWPLHFHQNTIYKR